jgi:hypothetical protein
MWLSPLLLRSREHAGCTGRHKDNTPQFGLIAEQVADVNPDLVVRDKGGEIYTVRYDAVNAMLLNEFLKTHCKVEDLQRSLSLRHASKSRIRKLQK